RERELTGGHHAGEAVEDLHVHPLELAGPAPDRRGRLACEDPDPAVLAADRNALDTRPLAAVDADRAVDALTQLPGARHHGAVDRTHDQPHLVLAVERLAGRGPDLGEDHEALAFAFV